MSWIMGATHRFQVILNLSSRLFATAHLIDRRHE